MKRKLTAGLTSASFPIFVLDANSSTGGGLGGLTHNTSGLVAEYRRQGENAWTAIALVAGTLGTFTSGGFVADGALAGAYEFCPPDAALASGARWVAFRLRGAANMVPCLIEVELDSGINYQASGETPAVVATPTVTTADGKTILTSGTGNHQLATVAGAVSATSDGQTWYVRTGGNDVNSGTSPAEAFATLAAAIAAASAGHTIDLGAGNFAVSARAELDDVHVRGAGLGKTRLIAAAAIENAILEAANHVQISDLTVVATYDSGNPHFQLPIADQGIRFDGNFGAAVAASIVLNRVRCVGFVDCVFVILPGTTCHAHDCIFESAWDTLLCGDSTFYAYRSQFVTNGPPPATFLDSQFQVSSVAVRQNSAGTVHLFDCNVVVSLREVVGNESKHISALFGYGPGGRIIMHGGSIYTASANEGSVVYDADGREAAITLVGVRMDSSKATDGVRFHAAVRSELSVELERIDDTITSRLPSSGYVPPLDAQATRNANALALSAGLSAAAGSIDDKLATAGGGLTAEQAATLAAADAKAAEIQATLAEIMGTDFDQTVASLQKIGQTIDTLPTSGGGPGAGGGNRPVNHNHGGVDALRIMSGGVGVDECVIRAYLKVDYDAGKRVVLAESITGSDGRWMEDMMLDPGVYVLSFDARGKRLKSMEVTVNAD